MTAIRNINLLNPPRIILLIKSPLIYIYIIYISFIYSHHEVDRILDRILDRIWNFQTFSKDLPNFLTLFPAIFSPGCPCCPVLPGATHNPWPPRLWSVRSNNSPWRRSWPRMESERAFRDFCSAREKFVGIPWKLWRIHIIYGCVYIYIIHIYILYIYILYTYIYYTYIYQIWVPEMGNECMKWRMFY
jgi:hypothetical protein